MSRFLIFSLLGFCLLTVSCDKEDELFLSVSCNNPVVESRSNFYFDVVVKSKSGTVDNIKVSSYDKDNGRRELTQFNPDVKEFVGTVDLVAPYAVDTMSISYTFDVHDTYGNKAMFSYSLKVVPSSEKGLKELTSIVLTYGDFTKSDAFDFRTLQPVKSMEVKDADIVLGYEHPYFDWTTLSDIMFVKQNTFDYSSATDVSIINAFKNSVKSFSVKNISSEDVILIGRVKTDTTSYSYPIGVAKIQTADTLSHKLWFNVKVLQ